MCTEIYAREKVTAHPISSYTTVEQYSRMLLQLKFMIYLLISLCALTVRRQISAISLR